MLSMVQCYTMHPLKRKFHTLYHHFLLIFQHFIFIPKNLLHITLSLVLCPLSIVIATTFFIFIHLIFLHCNFIFKISVQIKCASPFKMFGLVATVQNFGPPHPLPPPPRHKRVVSFPSLWPILPRICAQTECLPSSKKNRARCATVLQKSKLRCVRTIVSSLLL